MALVGSSPSASFLDSSGWHSDQGSQNPGFAWEFRLWKMIRSIIARLLAENSDARLAGTFDQIAHFLKKRPGVPQIHENRLNLQYTCSKTWARHFLRSPKPAAGNDDQPLRAGMCSCMSIYVHICPYMSVYVRIFPYMSVYVPICPYMSMYVHTVHAWIFINVNIY